MSYRSTYQNIPWMRRTRRRPSTATASRRGPRRRPSVRVSVPRNMALKLKSIEKKFISRELTSTALTQAWAGGEMNPTTFLCLTSCARGDDANQHVGRSMIVDSLRIRGILKLAELAGTTVQAPVAYRIIVYQDRQTNNAEASAEDVVDANPSNPVLAFTNLFEVARFKILGERLGMLTPKAAGGNGTANDTGAAHQLFKFAFTKMNMQVTYTLGGANVTDVADNSVQIAMIADGANVTVRYQSRAYFWD